VARVPRWDSNCPCSCLLYLTMLSSGSSASKSAGCDVDAGGQAYIPDAFFFPTLLLCVCVLEGLTSHILIMYRGFFPWGWSCWNNAEDKNARGFTSILHMSLHGVVLGHRNQLNFTLVNLCHRGGHVTKRHKININWEGSGRGLLRHYAGTCMEGLRVKKRNFSGNSASRFEFEPRTSHTRVSKSFRTASITR
jgi:hypothetical protein